MRDGSGAKTGYKNPPVVVKLDLIGTGQNSEAGTDGLGISCVGYIKDVRCRLHQPFKLGPHGAYNIPTWAEMGFTFVHRPSHSNSFKKLGSQSYGTSNIQAYADTVRSNLYNTANLILNDKTTTFQGFED